MTRRGGLTLIELLVVLTILVALAGVGLRSTVALEEQARFEATQRTLHEARDAVVGPSNARVPHALVAFVADVGRLPLSHAEVVDGSTFYTARELWDEDLSTTPPFGRYASLDPEVDLTFGWRGPYVQLPIGGDVLRDGWSRPLLLLDAQQPPQTITADGVEVFGFLSLGADNQVGGAAYSQDLPSRILSEDAFQPHLQVMVMLPATPTGGRVSLVVFAPNPDPLAATAVALSPTLNPDGTGGEWTQNSAGVPLTWTLSPTQFQRYGTTDPWELTTGPRIVRAYFDADGDGAPALPPTPLDHLSEPHPVVLFPGTNVITLAIP